MAKILKKIAASQAAAKKKAVKKATPHAKPAAAVKAVKKVAASLARPAKRIVAKGKEKLGMVRIAPAQPPAAVVVPPPVVLKQTVVVAPRPVAPVKPVVRPVPVKLVTPAPARIVPQRPAPVVPPHAAKPVLPKPAPARPVQPPPPIEAVRPAAIVVPVVPATVIEMRLPVSLKDLAVRLQQKSSVVIKKLMDAGRLVTLNNSLDDKSLEILKKEFNFQIKEAPTETDELLVHHKEKSESHLLKHRYPVVTLMGHVDHGKTSLLDSIKKSDLADKEYGGITQHIGAYEVAVRGGKITFLDTPGHEAFTAMRSRGARITDIVILVVAADDGIMPQTIEAVDHARAAAVPIVVAMNKIDKPGANIEKVKRQLAELNLASEDWGGKTITVGVSAKTGEGIDKLLEMVLLEAEMLELKADFERPARGVVIDSKVSKGRGPVATLLIQDGTLRVNDIVLVGDCYGKLRAMFDEHSRPRVSAGPSDPVEVLGLCAAPQPGEEFFVVDDEKKAREISLKRQATLKLRQMSSQHKLTLEELSEQIKEGKGVRELRIVFKADVQGSLEAAQAALSKIPANEVKLHMLHTGAGTINTSDVILASVSDALIFGFHVDADEPAKEKALAEGVQIRTYNVIYELVNELRAALEGLLQPKLKRVFLGRAEVKQVFKLTKSGIVAGCLVQKGKILRTADTLVRRGEEIVFEGKISALKRFKDDVKEVPEATECGISLVGFEDVKAGDVIESYQTEKIARKLE